MKNFETLWALIKWNISEAWWWLKYHLVPKHRYHILSLKQPNGYQYGWLDADQQILYACFNILISFVEKEMGGEKNLIEYINQLNELLLKDKEINAWAQEAVYDWNKVHNCYCYWKYRRPLLIKNDKRGENSIELYKSDTNMLKELMDVRGVLWT